MPRQLHRTETYLLRLTPQEKETWTSMAISARLTIAELIRKRMAGCHIKTITPINFQVHLLLGEITQNLLQISQNLDQIDYQNASQIDSIVKTIDKIRLQLLSTDTTD
ncbi:hypothetical protein QUB17_21300 [Microcoleus sp. B5-C4]|uniref:plasmid mobilization protein n=1 Tax=Microcoleus sp. B5-C4 TaxID=2818675 RepID=UPI002FD2D985